MARKTKPLDPIHPGEILMEEFMKPLGSASTVSRAICTFRPTGFTALCTGTALLPQTPLCAWEPTSA